MASVQSFSELILKSNLKIAVAETGIGNGIAYNLLNIPGISKVLVEARVPYSKSFVPDGMRAVCRERAVQLAREMGAAAKKESSYSCGIGVTGAIYDDRDSHFWMAFVHLGREYVFHVKTPLSSRRDIANEVYIVFTKLFGYYILKNNQPVDHSYNSFIDILDVGEDLNFKVEGIGEGQMLLIHDGKTHRPEDYLREYDYIYPGSFNPPHLAHEEIGKNAIWEICTHPNGKDPIGDEDLNHRIQMINKLGHPVLLTNHPFIRDKAELIVNAHPKRYKFLVGSDTWNRIVEDQDFMQNDIHYLARIDFRICLRPGYEVTLNDASDCLHYEVWTKSLPHSSTNERDSLENISDTIKQYIKQNNLYGQ